MVRAKIPDPQDVSGPPGVILGSVNNVRKDDRPILIRSGSKALADSPFKMSGYDDQQSLGKLCPKCRGKGQNQSNDSQSNCRSGSVKKVQFGGLNFSPYEKILGIINDYTYEKKINKQTWFNKYNSRDLEEVLLDAMKEKQKFMQIIYRIDSFLLSARHSLRNTVYKTQKDLPKRLQAYNSDLSLNKVGVNAMNYTLNVDSKNKMMATSNDHIRREQREVGNKLGGKCRDEPNSKLSNLYI